MYYVYVLKSEKDSYLYIGFTNNLECRLRQHNSGRVSSTKRRQPLSLVYKECFKDKQVAIKREKFLKSGCGREFLKKILGS